MKQSGQIEAECKNFLSENVIGNGVLNQTSSIHQSEMGAAASAQLTFQEFTLQTKHPLLKTFVR